MEPREVRMTWTNPAVGCAEAQCRRDGGELRRVEWTDSKGERLISEPLSPHGAKCLHFDLTHNPGFSNVVIRNDEPSKDELVDLLRRWNWATMEERYALRGETDRVLASMGARNSR